MPDTSQKRGRGRPAHSKTHREDSEWVKKNFPDTVRVSERIYALRQKYLSTLKAHDVQLANAETMPLQDLKHELDKRQLEPIKRKNNWKIAEKEIVDGMNYALQHDLCMEQKADGSIVPVVVQKNFEFCEGVGGSKESDVGFINRKTKKPVFFVECKLNFDTAEYFKFGLNISNGKIVYNHKHFLQGLDSDTDKEQIDKINRIFTQHIKLDEFLNTLTATSEMKSSWDAFLKNLQDVADFVKASSEYSDFAKGLHSLSEFPRDFAQLADVFDLYCKFYIEKYNTLIDQLFDLITDDDLQDYRKDFKITQRKSTDDVLNNEVFGTLNNLQVLIASNGGDSVISNRQQFNKIVNGIKIIEIKFNTLLTALDKDPSSFSDIFELNKLNKLKYFFKMFISSAGRRTTNNNSAAANPIVTGVTGVTDKFGNMQICSEITIDSPLLAQMITDFYTKKDKCGYIQIDDTVYTFHRSKYGIIGIKNLPVFADVLTNFTIMLSITDDLDRISLHIRCNEQKDKLKGRLLISFIKKHSNYILNKIKHIVFKRDAHGYPLVVKTIYK